MEYQFEIFSRTIQEGNSLNLKALRKECDALIAEWKTTLELASEMNNPNAHFALSSDIAQEIKDYFLYLRNAYLEKIYAEISLRSHLISEDKFNSFAKNQGDEYQRVRAACNKNIHQHLKQYPIDESYNYQLTHSPKETYSKQFAIIKNQFNEIQSFENNVRRLDLKLSYVQKNIFNFIDEKLEILKNIRQLLSDHKQEETLSIEEISSLAKQLEKQKGLFKVAFKKKAELDEFLKAREPYSIIPSYNNGIIGVTDLNVSYLIEYWLSFKVYKDLEINIKDADTGLNKMIISLKREIDFMLEAKDNPEIKVDFDRVRDVLKELPSDTTKLIKLFEDKKTDFGKDITVHALIYSQNFFDRRLSQSYDQLLVSSETFVVKIAQVLKFYADRAINFINPSRLNNLSENELVINYLKNFAKFSYNTTYFKLFHNQSGVYNHYTVQREEELKTMQEYIANWRSGLGNSMLIYGSQLCGKTTLLDSIAQTAKFDNIVRLAMSTTVEIDGRKIKLGEDLHAGLSELSKSVSASKNYLIIIDDIELWRDEKDLFSLQRNLNSLIHFMGNAPLNLFFIVSCSKIAFKRFDAVFSLSTIFSGIIDVSRTSWSEFYDALMRRQETTQMELQIDGADASSNKIRTIAKRIFKHSSRNLGLSLLTWSKNIGPQLEIKSTRFKNKHFPYIETKQNRQLLDNIGLFGKVTYQELLHNSSEAEVEQIRKMIGRYRKIGLLKLNAGHIEFNPHIAQRVEEQLLYAERPTKYTEYQIETVEENNISIKEIRAALMLDLLLFPFKGEGKLQSKTSKEKKVVISLNTVEKPAAIIQHINNRDHNIKVEFKRRLS